MRLMSRSTSSSTPEITCFARSPCGAVEGRAARRRERPPATVSLRRDVWHVWTKRDDGRPVRLLALTDREAALEAAGLSE